MQEAFRDFAAESAALSGNTAANDRTSRLAELFRPPFDIMARGDFESVRLYAALSLTFWHALTSLVESNRGQGSKSMDAS